FLSDSLFNFSEKVNEINLKCSRSSIELKDFQPYATVSNLNMEAQDGYFTSLQFSASDVQDYQMSSKSSFSSVTLCKIMFQSIVRALKNSFKDVQINFSGPGKPCYLNVKGEGITANFVLATLSQELQEAPIKDTNQCYQECSGNF
ncbi:MAG: cell cycle checkpoint control protein rad9a, partial [Paramarteilia canceri]